MGMFPDQHAIATSALLHAASLFIDFESHFGDDAALDLETVEAAGSLPVSASATMEYGGSCWS